MIKHDVQPLKPAILSALMGLFFLLIGCTSALAADPTTIQIRKALVYLQGVPEIAWIEIESNTVVLGWKDFGSHFARINKTAAKKASRRVPVEVRVFSVQEGQKGWRPDPENPTGHICHSTAKGGRVTRSSCH